MMLPLQGIPPASFTFQSDGVRELPVSIRAGVHATSDDPADQNIAPDHFPPCRVHRTFCDPVTVLTDNLQGIVALLESADPGAVNSHSPFLFVAVQLIGSLQPGTSTNREASVPLVIDAQPVSNTSTSRIVVIVRVFIRTSCKWR